MDIAEFDMRSCSNNGSYSKRRNFSELHGLKRNRIGKITPCYLNNIKSNTNENLINPVPQIQKKIQIVNSINDE